MLAYMGMLNQTQQNNANAMFDAQKLNNEYRGQAAKIKLAAGENSATRQSEAYRWDEDMLAKAHAARLNLWETSQYDRQNALESFFHNRFKKNQFDRMMDLYQTDQKMSEKDREFYRNQFLKNKNNTAQPVVPTLADNASAVTTTAGNSSIHPGQTTLPTQAVSSISTKSTITPKKVISRRGGKKAITTIKKSTPVKKNTASQSLDSSMMITAPTATSYNMYQFDNSAITNRFPNASNEARQARPNKEKAGRTAPVTNADALSRMLERFVLGKKEYERRYGKGS